jgi:hypothetical protein
MADLVRGLKYVITGIIPCNIQNPESRASATADMAHIIAWAEGKGHVLDKRAVFASAAVSLDRLDLVLDGPDRENETSNAA